MFYGLEWGGEGVPTFLSIFLKEFDRDGEGAGSPEIVGFMGFKFMINEKNSDFFQ